MGKLRARIEAGAATGARGHQTPAEQSLILLQLDRILEHPAFKNSKRSASLLRHLVLHALKEPEAHIKERTLGIEVFGRENEYDPAIDPVVRMAANEIRKRLAQYYHDPENAESDLEIELPAGTYIAGFRFKNKGAEPAAVSEPIPSAAELAPAPLVKPTHEGSQKRSRKLVFLLCAATLLLVLAGLAITAREKTTLYMRFWDPVANQSGRVLICMGTSYPPGTLQYQGNASDAAAVSPDVTQLERSLPPRQEIPLNDMYAASKVIGVLDARKKSFEVRSSQDSTLADLKTGAVVLVGVFDNDWGRKLQTPLRFRLADDWKARTLQITDSYEPARTDWVVNMDEPFEDLKSDYAIVSRYTSDLTGEPVVEVAGMMSYGTEAAAEFVSNPVYMNALQSNIANCKRNLQFVLQAQIINGVTGQPHVIASHCW